MFSFHYSDVSSQLDDSEHPEHRIYRKSAIRFSLLQRFRAIISEEQRRNGKSNPTHKQGSKSMGEKIAHPDYVDPFKLFSSSRNSSQANLSINESDKIEFDLMGEPEKLDMTISEKDVFKEIDKRMNTSLELHDERPISDTGQKTTSNDAKSSQASAGSEPFHKSDEYKHNVVTSSQSSDSFYESILEKNLNEETSLHIARNTSPFTNNCNKAPDNIRNIENLRKNTNNKKVSDSKVVLKRPTKAPPPIPVKPKGLSSVCAHNYINDKSRTGIANNKHTVSETISITNSTTVNGISKSESVLETNAKSWVKTMVGRFE